ncbi:MAG: hypothetical protein ACM31L_10925 [Actinomycetota bacterium]
MTDVPPDLDQLARRYLDLWQDQVAAMATDPALAEAVARGIAMMSQGTSALVQATQAAATAAQAKAGTDEPAAPGSDHSPDPQRSQAAAAAPDRPRDDAGRLEGRLAALEERVAALEAALGAGRGKPAPKPRRSKP